MSSILPFLRNATFDPDEIQVMSLAYDQARKALHDKGQPSIVNEVLATCIIALAANGERDAGKLADDALKGFGIDPSRAA